MHPTVGDQTLPAAGGRESYFEEHGDAYGKPCPVKAAGRGEGTLNSQRCKKWGEFVSPSGKIKRLLVTYIPAKGRSRLCCFATNALEDQTLS